MIIEEIWKDAVGYEGLYQVSNLGQVKSLNYKRTDKERILKPVLTKGYYSIGLCKNGKCKRSYVHKLVVEAFLGKISNGLVVNHLNEIKSDNRLENLEICTQKENINYGTCKARISESLRGEKHPRFGKKLSEEHKRKLSEAYWQKRREA